MQKKKKIHNIIRKPSLNGKFFENYSHWLSSRTVNCRDFIKRKSNDNNGDGFKRRKTCNGLSFVKNLRFEVSNIEQMEYEL